MLAEPQTGYKPLFFLSSCEPYECQPDRSQHSAAVFPFCSKSAWRLPSQTEPKLHSMPSLERRWNFASAAPQTPQWQPFSPPQQQAPRLPRTMSGPCLSSGWHTSPDLPLQWMRPAEAASSELARMPLAAPAPSSEPAQIQPPVTPGCPIAGDMMRRQQPPRAQPPPAGCATLRVVSSDWSPEGFQKTLGNATGRLPCGPHARTQPPQRACGRDGLAMGRGAQRAESLPATLFGGAYAGRHPASPPPDYPRVCLPARGPPCPQQRDRDPATPSMTALGCWDPAPPVMAAPPRAASQHPSSWLVAAASRWHCVDAEATMPSSHGWCDL